MLDLMRMRLSTMRKLRLLCLIAACVQLAAPPHAAAQVPGVPDFEPPADPRVPFLVMRTTPTELAGGHAIVLSIFGDGACELERPPIMRGPGLHRWQLNAQELQALVRQVRDAGVAELDAAALRASLKAAHASKDADGSVYRSDDDILEIELRLDRYRGPGGPLQRGFEHELRFVGLRGDRARHPADEQVRRVSELRDSLDAMARTHAPLPELVP